MTEDEILETLREIAREAGADVADDADLTLDSMAATTLVVAIEDRFRICLPDDELARVRRVPDLVGLVARRLAC